MADVNTLLQKYLLESVYVGTGSTDLTTNVSRRLKEMTTPVDMTARFKAVIVAAGGSN